MLLFYCTSFSIITTNPFFLILRARCRTRKEVIYSTENPRRSLPCLPDHHMTLGTCKQRWSMGRSCVWWLAVLVCCAAILPTKPSLALSTLPTSNGDPLKFVVLGGTGKIGTAVAAHLSHRLFKSPQPCEILLVGRRPSSDREYFQKALQEIEDLLVLSSNDNNDDGSLEQRPKIPTSAFPTFGKPVPSTRSCCPPFRA